MRRSLVFSLLLASAVASLPPGFSAEIEPSRGDPRAVEHFEKTIRPILATRCQQCHGEEKQKGGLRLDSRQSILTGGNSGPAVVPGKPSESLLVDAINHGDLVQMPPKSKLPAAEIASLTSWVREGAPWGIETSSTMPAPPVPANQPDASGPSDLVRKRGGFWSFRPIKVTVPPEPDARYQDWARNGVDRYILSGLARHKLEPAAEASRGVLIRRLSFDLVGLPPTPDDIAAFLADTSPDAYERLVDRLLASPRYGERWGRHWLDLARYADTAGHEFDYDLPNAFRYRDYVIRALNADLSYDRFVTEQIAGDLLQKPRRHPTEGSNESILGTGFFFLGEGTHSPVDVREEEVRRVDNQIDVLSKTFLGLTVGCARCHDHKFDPITARDYYALAGFLRSSRHQQAFLDGPGRIEQRARRLGESKESIRAILIEAIPSLPAELGTRLSAILQPAIREESLAHPDASAETSAAGNPTEQAHFEAFSKRDFAGWDRAGDAFGDGPSRPGEFLLEAIPRTPQLNDWRIRAVKSGMAHSGLLSGEFEGVLRSRNFTIQKRFVHVLASGRQGRINIVPDRFEKIRDPIYGALTILVDIPETAEPRWITRDVSMWAGHSAYFELADGSGVDYTGGRTRQYPGDGFLAVDEIVFSDQPAPPTPAPTAALPPFLLEPVLGALGSAGSPLAARLNSALGEYRNASAEIPEPTYGMAIIDGTPEDERVLIRGNHKNPGGPVPRRILEVLGGLEAPGIPAGSGRLELASRIVDPKNPLTARVMVNRLWQHHFGVGLVRSADDFGAMGQAPSHPELLDWLANRFVEQGWSIKAMHRLLVTSSTYRMSSTIAPAADRIDPTNTLLHRMNVRRLEGEVIRDALVAVATGLDATMYGPSVAVHLTDFMEGRGRPGNSGTLDGDRRRSIYLGVRRNFLNPLFLAFDTPAPFSTMGRRTISNVPAQALTLLNDPLILTQSRRWAGRILAEPAVTPSARIDRLYIEAFGRPPSAAEAAASLAFVTQVERGPKPGAASSPAGRSLDAWTDLCHVLINVKEFIYVE